MKKKLLIIFSFLILSLALYSESKFKNFPYYNSYNHNAVNGILQNIRLRIQHRGESVPWFITISSGGSGNSSDRIASNWSGDSFHYNLVNNETDKIIIKDISDNPTTAEVLSGVFPASNSLKTQRINLTVYVPPGYFSASGQFSDTVTMRLYEGTPTSYTLIESNNMQIAYQVPEIMELAIVNSGRPFNSANTAMNFDFGTLYTGQKQSADIMVRSTNPYTVRMSSANQGAMQRTDTWDTNKVPYICSIDGTVINLGGWGDIPVASGGVTDGLGNRHEIEVEIGDFWGITSGDYEDVLTVTLTAQW